MGNLPSGGSEDAGQGRGAGLEGGSADSGRPTGRRSEIVGPHLRIAGRIELGTFNRVTDLVNQQGGLFRVLDAAVLLRDGESADLSSDELWVSPSEVTVIAETDTYRDLRRRDAVFVTKAATQLTIVTPGHTITGWLYLPTEATLAAFIQSSEPPFLPVTEVRVRSLIDRHVEAEYPFALVNRRHIVAVSQVPESPSPGAGAPSLFDRLR